VRYEEITHASVIGTRLETFDSEVLGNGGEEDCSLGRVIEHEVVVSIGSYDDTPQDTTSTLVNVATIREHEHAVDSVSINELLACRGRGSSG
jgi:hypothetical protein